MKAKPVEEPRIVPGPSTRIFVVLTKSDGNALALSPLCN